MGHARTEDLRDVAKVLARIRALPGVTERSPGIFYIRSTSFLHFHTKADRRWADAKAGNDWGSEIPLPFRAGEKAKAVFLREVLARYRLCEMSAGRTAGVPSNSALESGRAKKRRAAQRERSTVRE